MAENEIQHAAPVPPFVRFVASAVPMVFDNSLSYYEALCALWKWMQDNLVDVINNNASVTEQYIEYDLHTRELFLELQNYVDTYFDNLDVQDEINNKLDAMAEAGTLQEIITSYIQANTAWCFNTVALMKSADNLIAGSYAQTLGYHSLNDGGNGLYKIRTITNSDVVDEAHLIAIGDNNLVAELIIYNEVHTKQFGCYGDDIHDDTVALQHVIDYATSHDIGVVHVDNGIYKISDTLTIDKIIVINGETWTGNTNDNLVYGSEIKQTVSGKKIFEFTAPSYRVQISNLSLNTNNESNITAIYGGEVFDEFIIDKVQFNHFDICLDLPHAGIGVISNSMFVNSNIGINGTYMSNININYNNFFNNAVSIKVTDMDGCTLNGNWFESDQNHASDIHILFQAPSAVKWSNISNNNFLSQTTSIKFDGTTNITAKMAFNMLQFTDNRFSGSQPFVIDMKNEQNVTNTNANNMWKVMLLSCVFNNVTSGQAIDLDYDALGNNEGWKVVNCRAYSSYSGGDTNMFTAGQSNTAVTTTFDYGLTTNGVIVFKPTVNGAVVKKNSIYMDDQHRLWIRTNDNASNKFLTSQRGATSARPATNNNMGDIYFDSTLNKPIWWTGYGWVDATGTAV